MKTCKLFFEAKVGKFGNYFGKIITDLPNNMFPTLANKKIGLPLKQTIIYEITKSNDYGIVNRDIYIFRTISGDTYIPGINNNIDLLLFSRGKYKSKKIHDCIKNIQKALMKIDQISPNYWIRQNARLHARREMLLPWQERNYK